MLSFEMIISYYISNIRDPDINDGFRRVSYNHDNELQKKIKMHEYYEGKYRYVYYFSCMTF